MRFLETEHQEIVAVLNKAGFNTSEYAFHKKRGQLHIILNNSSDHFIYYRKVESRLNSQGKFEDVTKYQLGIKKDTEVKSWAEVITALEHWIRKQ